MTYISRSQFVGQDEKRYWQNLDDVTEVKLVAKMLRELTHMKPPRGRTGRHLSYDGHFAIEVQNRNWRQDQFTGPHELARIENKGSEYGRWGYTEAAYSSDDEKASQQDLQRLAMLHKQYTSKLKVQNTTRSLEDLVQGLMGLGLKRVEYETTGYREDKYMATMYLDGFKITIEESGAG